MSSAAPTGDARPRTAVLMQFSGMGDLVWHVQYFRAVAEQSRDGQVTVIAPPSAMARELLGHEPWVREVVDFDRRPRRSERRRGRHSGLDGLLRFGAELAPKQLERMVIFSDHPGRAVIVCWRAGIRVRLGYGATWLQRLLLTKAPQIQMYEGPAVAAYQDASNFAIAQGFCTAPIVPRISVRPDALTRMHERLAGLPRPLYAFSIGSSEPYKQWGAENFAALASLLLEAGGGVLILGGPAEAALAQAIVTRMAPELHSRTLAITDGTVAETVAAMSLVDHCIGNDTGATNIAAAVGTPTLVLLGPRPPLTHDPDTLKLLQAPQLADIKPATVAQRLLATEVA
jgi:heptosyltransferase II